MIPEPIVYLLGLAGGSVGLWAAAVGLTRVLLTHGLKKDLENHAANLKATTDAQISRFNSELKIEEFEHQLRFAKVYERQAEVIRAFASL